MVRGFESWNVPLHQSLNCMPPRTHWSGLKSVVPPTPITGHMALPSSDFVLTWSSEGASVNIWSTRAGLTRVFALNFKLQAWIDPGESLERAQLHFLSYDAEDGEQGVKIYSRSQAGDHKQSSDAKQVEAEQEKEKGDGELMQAMFDES